MVRQTALGVIFYENQTLIGRKDPSSSSFLADQWQLIGGGVKPDESTLDGLVREIDEESGLRVNPIRTLGYQYLQEPNIYLSFTYCQADSRDAQPDSDIIELRWTDPQYVTQICREAAAMWPEQVREFFEDPATREQYLQSYDLQAAE